MVYTIHIYLCHRPGSRRKRIYRVMYSSFSQSFSHSARNRFRAQDPFSTLEETTSQNVVVLRCKLNQDSDDSQQLTGKAITNLMTQTKLKAASIQQVVAVRHCVPRCAAAQPRGKAVQCSQSALESPYAQRLYCLKILTLLEADGILIDVGTTGKT